MAYTDRFDPFMRRRDDRSDLLKEAEDSFYGGGNAPRPSPTPTATPRPTQLAMNGQPSGVLSTSTNAAGRVRTGGGILNVTPDDPVSSSRYLGPNGTDLGPQYDPTGAVNPLPKGAIGVQGSQNATAFNRSLNGSQPIPGAAPSPQMTHTEMAADIAKRNLTASGSLLGDQPQQQQQIPAGFRGYVSPERAASEGLQWTGGNTGWQPYVSPEEATKRNLQFTGGLNNVPSQQDQPTTHFLPPGFTSVQGSTGAPNSSPNDIHFLPPGFTSVQGTTNPQTKQLQFVPPPQKQDEGYGSAYGY
jgi:hypothetical protein